MSEVSTALVDAVQGALELVKENVQSNFDLDGARIRLETVYKCLVWVEPLFESLASFSSLQSAVSEMIDSVITAAEQELVPASEEDPS
jgi:hypothetical protein